MPQILLFCKKVVFTMNADAQRPFCGEREKGDDTMANSQHVVLHIAESKLTRLSKGA